MLIKPFLRTDGFIFIDQWYNFDQNGVAFPNGLTQLYPLCNSDFPSNFWTGLALKTCFLYSRILGKAHI